MPDFTLTPDDRKAISDLAARLEGRQQFCRQCRWFAVAYVILSFSLLLYAGHTNSNWRSMLSLPPAALRIPKNAGPEQTTAVLERIVSHNDLEVLEVRDEIYMMLSGLILVATGIVCFLYFFGLSLNTKHDNALAKLLRSVASYGSDSGDTGGKLSV